MSTSLAKVAEGLAGLAAEHMREARDARRRADAARPVGTEGLTLGITDYRKQPERRIDADDWAVWRVRWDGREWVRIKRLAGNKSLTEAFESIKIWGAELGLARVE